MSTEANKATNRRWFEGWNTRDVSVLENLADKTFTTDFILHDPSFPAFPPGPASVKQFVRDVLKNTPDVHITIEDIVAEGDRLACRFELRGTDVSTGKPVHLLIMSIGRFAGGKIAEAWQLGVPAAAQA